MTLAWPKSQPGDLLELPPPLLSVGLPSSVAAPLPRSASAHGHGSVHLGRLGFHSVLRTPLVPTNQPDKLLLWRRLRLPTGLPPPSMLAHPTDLPSGQSSRMPLRVSWLQEVPESRLSIDAGAEASVNISSMLRAQDALANEY